ncbi:toll/interleukin-1 receptor domain-containing protein [Sphingomonas profundi]|uniref:toll/interleukin-1 receptor domain-containing protein n=1 Tax=Alterirhizorhabdus profundi TaxID=2681549 RepID=UPI0012E80CDA|nr:toll/interleukin-1 receptor domain-containing protein [Sphingomonas profundi]
MSDIFVSHAQADGARAGAIVAALRGAGYDVTAGGREPADALAAPAKLSLILWSRASVEAADGGAVLDQAEAANGRGGYLGVLLDEVALPFGFGGSSPVDVAPFREGNDAQTRQIVDAARNFMATGQAPVAALPPPPPPPVDRSGAKKLAALAAVAIAIVGAIVWFVVRSSAPTTGELIEAQLGKTPCAWLRVDPVQDGSNGRLGLTGVAGNPAQAGAAVLAIAQAGKMAVTQVSTDKVAQIDPRECAAIDEPRRLRRSPGGRLLVTGEPFVLDYAIKPKPQALARVQIALEKADSSMALFGVEPNGQVTWILPDKAALDALKDADVGLTSAAPGKYEFSVYPDHLGWTGLFLVVGEQPLAATKPQGTVQSAGEFAPTLRQATGQGKWDADMVWFRIDPK